MIYRVMLIFWIFQWQKEKDKQINIIKRQMTQNQFCFLVRKCIRNGDFVDLTMKVLICWLVPKIMKKLSILNRLLSGSWLIENQVAPSCEATSIDIGIACIRQYYWDGWKRLQWEIKWWPFKKVCWIKCPETRFGIRAIKKSPSLLSICGKYVPWCKKSKLFYSKQLSRICSNGTITFGFRSRII